MNSAALNDIWIRIIETFTKGIAFAVLAVVFALLARRKDVLFRGTLAILSACWVSMSAAGFTVSGSLYRNHSGAPPTPRLGVAWTQGPACIAAMILAVYAVGEYPRMAAMLAAWSQMHIVSRGQLADLDVVAVKVRPVRRVLDRLHRKRAQHGTS